MKNTLFTLIYLISFNFYAQNFQKTLHEINMDYNHFNLECHFDEITGIESTFICGTAFLNGYTTEGRLARLDGNGNQMWSRNITYNEFNVRILDLTVAETMHEGNIIGVTGYITDNANSSKLIFLSYDFFGNLLNKKIIILNDVNMAIGTNIIYSKSEDLFLIGGFTTNTANFLSYRSISDIEYTLGCPQTIPASCLLNSKDILFKISTQGLLLSSIYSYGNSDLSSINDIVETNTGYFIIGNTGEYDNPNHIVYMTLAIDLGTNLNVLKNYSFTYTNDRFRGVSIDYNKNKEKIYLLSNGSWHHEPIISEIDLVSQTVDFDYVMDLKVDNSSSAGDDFAGFQILFNEPLNKVIVAGYKRFVGELDGSTGISWITSFDVLPNGFLDTNDTYFELYTAPTNKFPYHGGVLLSSFYEEAPTLFTQEIIDIQFNNVSFKTKFLAPRFLSPDNIYAIDLLSQTTNSDGIFLNSCIKKDSINFKNPCEIGVPDFYCDEINVNRSIVPGYAAIIFPSSLTHIFEEEKICEVYNTGQERVKYINKDDLSLSKLDADIYPNPSNGEVLINFNSSEELQANIVIRDILGKIVLDITSTSSLTKLDLNSLKKGVYTLLIDNNSSILTKKIILID